MNNQAAREAVLSHIKRASEPFSSSSLSKKPNEEEESDLQFSDEDLAEEILKSADSEIERASREVAVLHVEEELRKNAVADIQRIKMPALHAHTPLSVCRAEPSQRNNSLLSEVQPIAKRAAKKILDELEREDEWETSLMYGRRIDAGKTYRRDQRFWAKRNDPGDPMNLALYILCDGSGSMIWDDRMNATRKSALLLYEFSKMLNIPAEVAVHDVWNDVRYNILAIYDNVDSLDSQRICTMEPGGNNRDGMALRIAAERLKTRTERKKCLFIISDGQPNDSDYGGLVAENDIKEVVKEAKKSNIEIIPVAIGSDKEQINRIYGDFIDITNLQTMPRQLLKFLKRRVLS